MRRVITITLQVETTADADQIERAIECWLDPEDLDGTGIFEDGDSLELLDTQIQVGAPPAPPSQSTQACGSREHIEDMDHAGHCLWCKRAIVRAHGAWVLAES